MFLFNTENNDLENHVSTNIHCVVVLVGISQVCYDRS